MFFLILSNAFDYYVNRFKIYGAHSKRKCMIHEIYPEDNL